YGPGDFDAKERQMQKLPSYKTVFNDLYPQLRVAKTEILAAKEKKTEAEIVMLAGKIANGSANGEELTEQELAFAAAINPGWEEKVAIYEAQARIHNSLSAFNNLGAAYLNLANRTINRSEKNILLTKAQKSFENAIGVGESASAYHNLGQSYLLMGDYISAYEAFYKASSLAEENEEL